MPGGKLGAVFAAIVICFAAFPAAGSARTQGVSLTRSERALLKTINRVRAKKGLKPLVPDRRLEQAARSHSADMAAKGYFDHGPFAARMMSFGVRARRVGENLAWGATQVTPKWVVQAWLRSPEHRANLLHGGYRRIGVGAALGSYQGVAATMITADFAGT